MRRVLQLSLVLVASAALAGCADCSRDPSQVGLGCATANLASGVYEEDDAKIRREIAALEARRAELDAEAARYQAEADRLQGERQRYARRVAQLNQETAALNRQVADLNRQGDVDQARLAALRAEERALSDQVLALSRSGGDQGEIDRLNGRIAALKEQIRRLVAAS